MSTLSSVEEILRNRVKIVGEGEWTLLGTPDDVIKELEALINQQIKSVLDEIAEAWESDEVLLSAIQKIRSRYE